MRMKARNQGKKELPRIVRDAALRFSRREQGGAHGAFDAELASLGLRGSVKTTVATGTAAKDITALLGVGARKAVLIRSREMFANDRPVQLAVSYLSRDITAGTPIENTDVGPGGTYSCLGVLGHDITEFSETVTVRRPEVNEAAFLGLDPDDPDQCVYAIRRTAADQDGMVAEVTDTVMPVERFTLVYRWPADPWA
jgi:GntR family transcriptional regulator